MQILEYPDLNHGTRIIIMQVELWKCKYVLKNQLSIIFTAPVRRIAGDMHLI